MKAFIKIIVVLLFGGTTITQLGFAQDYMSLEPDTNGVTKIIMDDGDTAAFFYLDNHDKYVKKGKELSFEQKKYWATLRHNVRKVYPYSIRAAQIINQVEKEVAGKSKKERRNYLKEKEKELKHQYKNELKDLSMTQGRILVKLINRHTGKDAYSLIKELKGSFSARMSQTGAYFFDNNLKSTYDPYNEDRDIEIIVKEIESQGSFR